MIMPGDLAFFFFFFLTSFFGLLRLILISALKVAIRLRSRLT
jgi:hypothetical protein